MKLKSRWYKTLAWKLTGNCLAELVITGDAVSEPHYLKPANRPPELGQGIRRIRNDNYLLIILFVIVK